MARLNRGMALALAIAGVGVLGMAMGQEKEAKATKLPPIPEDFLGDEHIREEFGINEWTTPSIGKIFDIMGGLGRCRLMS
jgi:hypothetical protein